MALRKSVQSRIAEARLALALVAHSRGIVPRSRFAGAKLAFWMATSHSYNSLSQGYVIEFRGVRFVVNQAGGLGPISIWFYEPVVCSVLSKITGECFIDIGSNVGAYPLNFARNFTRVIAVEPGDVARRILKENIRLNNIENVVVDARAVWNQPGQVHLKHSSYLVNWHVERSSGGNNFSVVPAVTLDELIAPIETVDLMKIDVEGGELAVIASGRASLRRVMLLVMEVRARFEAEIVSILESTGHDHTILEDRVHIGERNILFYKRERFSPETVRLMMMPRR